MSPSELLDLTNQIRIWAAAIAVIAGIMTAAASYYQVVFQKRVASEKEDSFQSYKVDAERKTAEAKESAARSLEQAAETQKQMELARLEQEKLRQQNLEVERQLEDERRERLGIQAAIGPRIISTDQAAKFAAAFRPLILNQEVYILVLQDSEIQNYAMQIAMCVKMAGGIVKMTYGGILVDGISEGIDVTVPADRFEDFQKAFEAARIVATIRPSRPREADRLYVTPGNEVMSISVYQKPKILR